jgi:hypothetical protein
MKEWLLTAGALHCYEKVEALDDMSPANVEAGSLFLVLSA